MYLILLEAVLEPVHHRQLIGRRKVSLSHTRACHLHRGGVVSFVIVTGGVPPVSVASQIIGIPGWAKLSLDKLSNFLVDPSWSLIQGC